MRRGRGSESAKVGLIGTVAVHALAGLFLVAGAAAARKPLPPTYRVHLVAAPEPTEDARKAPEAVDRPAEEKPAPTPKAVNVRFFACAAAAEAAGFRACLRCRPQAAPGTPAWLGSAAVVSRALRLIGADALDDDDVEALAARVGLVAEPEVVKP